MSYWSYYTPKSYTEQYHELTFPHPRDGATMVVNITKYGSGWRPPTEEEKKKKINLGYNRTEKEMGPRANAELNGPFLRAIRKLHHGNPGTPAGSPFDFSRSALRDVFFDINEPFYAMSFTRAFLGKGSPDEMKDTLRMALLTGRIGSAPDVNGVRPAASSAQEYADLMFSLDCNALTGNYWGVNPDQHISNYANATRARKKLAEIKPGDALVTVDAGTFEHVAMVHLAVPLDAGAMFGNAGAMYIEICEWGEAGQMRPTHFKALGGGSIEVKPGAKTRDGWGLMCKSGTKERYFFGPPNPIFQTRGWGLAGNWNA